MPWNRGELVLSTVTQNRLCGKPSRANRVLVTEAPKSCRACRTRKPGRMRDQNFWLTNEKDWLALFVGIGAGGLLRLLLLGFLGCRGAIRRLVLGEQADRSH